LVRRKFVGDLPLSPRVPEEEEQFLARAGDLHRQTFAVIRQAGYGGRHGDLLRDVVRAVLDA
jgi:hypothetical protein